MRRTSRNRCLIALASVSIGLASSASSLAQLTTTTTTTTTITAPHASDPPAAAHVTTVTSATAPGSSAGELPATGGPAETDLATPRIEFPAQDETPESAAAVSPAPAPRRVHHGPASEASPRMPPLTGPQPEHLALRGLEGAWFYRPSSGGRQRVLVYLHARNSNPREACRRWHESTPRFGWLVCPIGPVDRGNGRREWRNNSDYAHRESIAAVEEMYRRYPRRVRRHDNVIMGFSEGAYTAMNVGLMEPLTFPRWFIIAPHDGYIDNQEERITRAMSSVRRIYLLTGEHDEIVTRSRRAGEMLTRAYGRRRVRLRILPGAGHELPPQFRRTTRGILLWVTQ